MKTKFKEGKIIEIFYVEKRGKKIPVIIRYPKKSDVNGIWKFYNKVIKETEFLSRITPVSLKDEKKWVANAIKSMKKGNSAYIIIESDGKIVGSSTVERKSEEVHKHVGGFGIAILQEYTGIGLGRRLMELIEKEAKNMELEIIQLSVYGKNKVAHGLYKKTGFIEACKIPKLIKRKNSYDDDIIMYKALKK